MALLHYCCLAHWLEEQGFFWIFFLCIVFNTASSAAPRITLHCVGIELRTVATSALAVSRSLTTRLDLIHWLAGTSQEPVFTSQSVEWRDCDVTAEQVYNTVEWRGWDREKAWVY
jgi:hypothetical protein